MRTRGRRSCASSPIPVFPSRPSRCSTSAVQLSTQSPSFDVEHAVDVAHLGACGYGRRSPRPRRAGGPRRRPPASKFSMNCRAFFTLTFEDRPTGSSSRSPAGGERGSTGCSASGWSVGPVAQEGQPLGVLRPPRRTRRRAPPGSACRRPPRGSRRRATTTPPKCTPQKSAAAVVVVAGDVDAPRRPCGPCAGSSAPRRCAALGPVPAAACSFQPSMMSPTR